MADNARNEDNACVNVQTGMDLDLLNTELRDALPA
jgi:hypothetical protein